MENVSSNSYSLWLILGAAGIWALYNSVGEVHAKHEHDAHHESPAPTATLTPTQSENTEKTKKTTFEKLITPPQLLSSSDLKYAIFSVNVNVMTFWERLIPILISIFSAGLGYWIVYPWFAFYHYKNSAAKLKLPGVDKVEFHGDIVEFWKIYLWNGLATFFTLGFYNFLGYAEYNITRYVDYHLKFK